MYPYVGLVQESSTRLLQAESERLRLSAARSRSGRFSLAPTEAWNTPAFAGAKQSSARRRTRRSWLVPSDGAGPGDRDACSRRRENSPLAVIALAL